LDEDAFTKRMAEVDSGDLVNYLRNCNDSQIKEEYYKRTENILGVNYLNLLKLAVDDERYFDDTEAKWDERLNSLMEKWRYISCVINAINVILYFIKIHDNILALILVPFGQLFIFEFVCSIIKLTISIKGGDKKYIKTYYPELARKLNIDGRNDFAWIAFIKGKYIDYNKDMILDAIRIRRERLMLSTLHNLKISLIFFVISLLAIFIKAYLKYN
jgi:hypothetical protein